MLFMVVEHFKNRDAKGVYRRFGESGHQRPEGLQLPRKLDRTDSRYVFGGCTVLQLSSGLQGESQRVLAVKPR